MPTGPKISEVLRAGAGRLAPVGGYGGVCYYDELSRGIVASFVGCGTADVFLDIERAYRRGDGDGAARRFHRYLPLLLFQLTTSTPSTKPRSACS